MRRDTRTQEGKRQANKTVVIGRNYESQETNTHHCSMKKETTTEMNKHKALPFRLSCKEGRNERERD
jgi:hypothetical protein